MSTPTPEQPNLAAAEARTGDIRLLVEQVLKFFVDHPEEVVVEEVRRTGSSLELEIQVAQKDIGKVIGKQGRTIRSLRTLAEAAGVVQNLRCTLELLEEDDLSDDLAPGHDEGDEPHSHAEVPKPEPGNEA